MRKILISTVAILSLSSLGACDIQIESYTPENPPPRALQFSLREVAHYCGMSRRQLKRIQTPYGNDFNCVKMYADQGHVSAMTIVGKAYRHEGMRRKARYYLSLARQY